jgi:glycopeptide antibiotics resistance protein
VRGVYAAGAFLFVAFAVWGSLFPFDVRPLPPADALSVFLSAWQTGPASWSRSDFASNVILFVPIGLFLCATVDTSWPRHRRWWAAVALAAAVLLSTVLEFAQALVPSRSSSIVDVLAETLGAGAGVVIWRFAARSIDRSVTDAYRFVRGVSYIDRVLLGYCALFGLAWLLPLDFTLRPNEIADKFEHKRLLLPFSPSPDAISPAMLILTCALSIPIGVAAMRLAGRGRRPIATTVMLTVPALVALEAAQVTVFSRTTDATALIAAVAGVLAGAAATRLIRSGEPAAPLRSGTAG